MYMLSGRGMQTGRGDNRPLGFYGVGKLADTTLDVSASGDGVSVAPGFDYSSQQAQVNALINSGRYVDSSTTTDPLTGLATYVASPTNPYPTAVPKVGSSNTTLILIALGVVGLMIAMKR